VGRRCEGWVDKLSAEAVAHAPRSRRGRRLAIRGIATRVDGTRRNGAVDEGVVGCNGGVDALFVVPELLIGYLPWSVLSND
jgi:hypothetical protein